MKFKAFIIKIIFVSILVNLNVGNSFAIDRGNSRLRQFANAAGAASALTGMAALTIGTGGMALLGFLIAGFLAQKSHKIFVKTRMEMQRGKQMARAGEMNEFHPPMISGRNYSGRYEESDDLAPIAHLLEPESSEAR